MVSSMHCLCQSKLKTILFDSDSICSSAIRPSIAFKKHDETFIRTLLVEQIIHLELTSKCKHNRVSIATSKTSDKSMILFGNTIMDLIYPEGFTSTVYHSIDTALVRNGRNFSDLQEFVKPGKFFCFDEKKSLLRIISINSCSNPQQFRKILDYLTANQIYDKVIRDKTEG